nr:protein multipolar spindle 1 isoform X2 [Tanacetum cinerariifolium]
MKTICFLERERKRDGNIARANQENNDEVTKQLRASVDFLMDLCDTISNPDDAKFTNWSHQAMDFILLRIKCSKAFPLLVMSRFDKYETAKELWEAILKTFGGNEATKKTKKNQLKLQYGNFKAEGSETLEQTFNRLQAIVKVQKKSGSNSQNMAFISSSNTSSGKGEVHTASIQVSTSSTDVVAASLSHDTICVYIATQSNGSQIKYEDITQIDEDDIEEIDIKWNMALLSMRADRF